MLAPPIRKQDSATYNLNTIIEFKFESTCSFEELVDWFEVGVPISSRVWWPRSKLEHPGAKWGETAFASCGHCLVLSWLFPFVQLQLQSELTNEEDGTLASY